MTIRQSVAMFYGIAALAVAAIHFAPGVARAVGQGIVAPSMVPVEVIEPNRTGHAEIDDLPAYLTEEAGNARL